MKISEFVVKFYDKAYEDKSIDELVKAPVATISGVSESDAVDLKKAFGIETVEDFATNKHVMLAQGINCFSGCSAQILESVRIQRVRESSQEAGLGDLWNLR